MGGLAYTKGVPAFMTANGFDKQDLLQPVLVFSAHQINNWM